MTCAPLNDRPPGSIQALDQEAVACEGDSNTKILLDKAKVEGTDLESAAANVDSSDRASLEGRPDLHRRRLRASGRS